MRGFVPTPDAIVDLMVAKLFDGRPPTRQSTVLDPGCGFGAFEEGILRWCRRNGRGAPSIVGFELDAERASEASRRLSGAPSIAIRSGDFLTRSEERFDYIIGNPPYVSITHLSESEKTTFRAEYATARGRFDLYLLFFEQALRMLKPDGRLVFITPEKFLYVKTAEPLRRLIAGLHVREVHLLDEGTFGGFVTYPAVTTIDGSAPEGRTRALLRDGTQLDLVVADDGASLLPQLNGHARASASRGLLEDACIRVSCGVATGSDGVFVRETKTLSAPLARFAYPTIAGRQLAQGNSQLRTGYSMLIPYDQSGHLLAPDELGALGEYLSLPAHQRRLEARTCVRRKPWYAFHDSVPLRDILRPKLICKDISAKPSFWVDREGTLVPRHSAYYIVPKDASQLDELAEYLNGPEARTWLGAHCQRAANGYLRLQSSILKKLPLPAKRGSDAAE